MVTRVLTGNISGEETDPSGNILPKATRHVNACARRTSANSIGQGRTVWHGREGSKIAAADATEVAIASAYPLNSLDTGPRAP
jgi:hypothetical protein